MQISVQHVIAVRKMHDMYDAPQLLDHAQLTCSQSRNAKSWCQKEQCMPDVSRSEWKMFTNPNVKTRQVFLQGDLAPAAKQQPKELICAPNLH